MFKHWPWTPAALVAALLIAAPTNASAVPVPPPDVDPIVSDVPVVEECMEDSASSGCPATMTVETSVNGVVVHSETCSLAYEEIAQYTGLFVWGHFFIYVEGGWIICLYPPCGGFAGASQTIIIGTL